MLESYLKYLEARPPLLPGHPGGLRPGPGAVPGYLREAGLEGRELTASEARGFVGWLSGRGLGSRSINRALSAVRGFFRFARAQGGQAGSDPFRGGALAEGPVPPALLPPGAGGGAPGGGPSRALPAGSFWELRDRLILELLYATGCRVSELAAVNLTDLDLAGRSIRVRGKGGKERVVFYGAPAAAVLKECLRSRRAPGPGKGRGGGQGAAAQPAGPAHHGARHPGHRGKGPARLRPGQAGQPAHLPALLRHPPAGPRRGHPRGAGAARARQPVHAPRCTRTWASSG